MCGILGIVGPKQVAAEKRLQTTIQRLFLLSESRGKEASGIAFNTGREIFVHKSAEPASELFQDASFQAKLSQYLSAASSAENPLDWFSFIGHTRLMTNGAQGIQDNNQPVVYDQVVGIHNGIIVNPDEYWQARAERPKSQLDSEALFAEVAKRSVAANFNVKDLLSLPELLHGAISLACFHAEAQQLYFYTNTGSFYYYFNAEPGCFVFASEFTILDAFLRSADGIFPQGAKPTRLKPGSALAIDLLSKKRLALEFVNGESRPEPTPRLVKLVKTSARIINQSAFTDMVKYLKRCSRCILPETFPYIHFDHQGVCNYCLSHQKYTPLGIEALREVVAPHRKADGEPDSLVAFSGGRDSSYCLHVVRKELGLNPITYTYDWGMVTPLARRNIARMTGILGVENILVSADIKKKRRFIRMNVEAWLKRPALGTVPLFMAGDKAYYYHANRLSKALNLPLIFLASNPFEKTNFKTGFCGVHEGTKNSSGGSIEINDVSLANKMKLLKYYGKEFALNPRFLNSSLADTFVAFLVTYFMKHEYCRFFNYIPWDEARLDSVLSEEYDWELASDTKNSWRIGDGTAAFYNYIYYTVAGFTEHDTFKSNQIREGLLTREQALARIYDDNEPRFESIREYTSLINLDFDYVMQKIQSMPKLYDLDLPDKPAGSGVRAIHAIT